MRRYGLHAVLAAAIILLDQLTKAVIVRTVPYYGSLPVIPGFLDLTHIRNSGAILGLFGQMKQPWMTVILLVLNAAALGLVIYYFSKTAQRERLVRLALALIAGGALGNIVDRLARGYVIDFVDMHAGRFHWPTYNVADACITIGAVLLIAGVIFRGPHASDPV